MIRMIQRHSATMRKPSPYYVNLERESNLRRNIAHNGSIGSRRSSPSRLTSLTDLHPPSQTRRWDKLSLASPLHFFFFLRCKFTSIKFRLFVLALFLYLQFIKHIELVPVLTSDLLRLRRVSPELVSEVLKVESDPNIASKFFAWAGKQKGFRHNFASYNAFAYCLNRLNRFRSADQVVELMNLQGKRPSEKQFEILIRMHSDKGRGIRVWYVYQKMRKFGVKARVFLYNRIMDALVKTGHLDLAMSVYGDFRADGLVEESMTFMILVKGLCREGRVDEVFELLVRMRGLGFKPDVFAYTAMIRVLVSVGDLEGCLRVWEEMVGRDRVEPDAMAYTTLVTALCRGGEVERGFGLFREMKGRGFLIDRAVYGALVEGFVAGGNVGSACDVLRDLMASGYRADLLIYNSLIEGLCIANKIDKACKLFHVTVRDGLNPDFNTVNPILLFYADRRLMDEFSKMLEHTQKLGLPVIDYLSKFFLSFIEKGNGGKKALEVFEDLKPKGSSVVIYNILIESLHTVGEVKEALSLFEEMKGSDFKPDSSTYSNVIPCFVQNGDIKEACSCYNTMTERSWVPSVSAYRSLVGGLSKIGEIDAALMLVRDCLSNVESGPMEFKYSLTIIHACKSGNSEKVIEVLNEMVEQECPPGDLSYSAVISGMCNYGTIEEARKVFEIMRRRSFLSEADVIVYDEFLVEHMKKKTAGLILSGLKFFGLESKLRSKGSTLLPA
ncbi:hypothetical protein Scep_013987 [Stephania cephalantha]|uniref:PROP1-like PPR domain-containing protein n=1 Tax=Stephania cephalantha TaxID=152367 RepID=A0AAP0P2J7_9MAGN